MNMMRCARVVALIISALAMLPRHAHAQVAGEGRFSIERFRLAMDREGLLDVEWGAVPGHRSWDVALWLGAADEPLILYRETRGEPVAALVKRRHAGTLVAGMALWERLELGIELPLILSQSADEPGELPLTREFAGYMPGDVRVMGKLHIFSVGGVDVALMASLTAPTGSGEEYRGDSGVSFAPELVLSRRFGAMRMAANLGYRMRDDVEFFNLRVEDELVGRLGLGWRVAGPLELDATLSAATAAKRPFGAANQDHLELVGGFHVDVTRSLQVMAAGGAGIRQGFGTPDWRVVAGVRVSLHRRRDADEHARFVMDDNAVDPVCGGLHRGTAWMRGTGGRDPRHRTTDAHTRPRFADNRRQSASSSADTPESSSGALDELMGRPDAIIVTIARKRGKEVGRWDGPMDYQWELPAQFTATKADNKWVWSDEHGDDICIKSGSRRHGSGTQVTRWAQGLGADEVEILLMPHPGPPEEDASEHGYGTRGQGSGGDRTAHDTGATSHQDPASTVVTQDDVDERAALADQAAAGTGSQGTGTGPQGARGDGDGVVQGRRAGYEQGSEDPSWNTAPGAEIDNDAGGRTPTNEGELGGSAGGEPGGTGHALGSGWFDIIDSLAAVAPVANVVIILADANITGIGDRLFRHALKQISKEALAREVEREIKSAMRSVTHEPRRGLSKTPAFRALPEAEKARVLKEMEDAAERELYEELAKYASRRADEFERTAAKYADTTDELDQHTRKVALENATAYRRIEEACAVKTGGSVSARPGDEVAQRPYDPHQTRQELETRYPGRVESTTVPPANKPNVKRRNQKHDKTRIVYDQRGFPIFDDVAVYETRLPRDVWTVKNPKTHMSEATKQLYRDIQAGRVNADKFTPKQMQAIKKGKAKIPGYTWHHHQDPGRMQLVSYFIHKDSGHVGGYNMWYKESK